MGNFVAILGFRERMDSPPQRVNQRRLQRALETLRQRESPNKNVKWETETKHETERERKKNDLEFSVCVIVCAARAADRGS